MYTVKITFKNGSTTLVNCDNEIQVKHVISINNSLGFKAEVVTENKHIT